MRTTMTCTLAMLMLVCVAPPPVQAQQGIDPVRVKAFADSFFAAELSAHHYRNGAIVVVHDTTLVLAAGYGKTEAGSAPDPFTTTYRIASVSKLFVATAVMQLAQTGRVDLNADVNRYLKTFKLSDARGPVTLATLLTHTSGIENRMLGGLARDSASLKPLGRYFSERPPHVDAKPGTQFSYSNNGMALAGYIVETVSGEPFDVYVQRRILTPLGMRHSSFAQPTPRDLAAHLPDTSRNRRAPFFNPYPAASLVATPVDMSRFIVAHLNNGRAGAVAILDSATIADMQRTHWTASPGVQGAAYGFFESRINGERMLFHTGDAGHHGLLLLMPDRRIGIYVVFDTDDSGTLAMFERFTRAFLAKFVGKGRTGDLLGRGIAPVHTNLRRYAGTYMLNGANPHTVEKLSGLMQIVVRATSPDTLQFKAPDGSVVSGTPVAGDVFALSDGGTLVFEHTVGKPNTFTLTGSIWDPQGAHRIGPLLDIRYQKIAAIIIAVALASRAVLALVITLVARHGSARARALRRTAAWRISLVILLLVMFAPVVAVVSIATATKPIVAVPGGIALSLLFLALASVSAVVMPVFAMRLWKDTTVAGWHRWYTIGFSAAILLLPVVLGCWNLLGWRY